MSSMMEKEDLSIVRVEKLKKVYRAGETSLTVLEGLDMEVRKGEVAAIVGRSGSGKSTLLNLIGGLDQPTEGMIWVEGDRIDNASEEILAVFRNTRIGFIFQFHHLLSEFSVCENVMMPALIRCFDTDRSCGRAIELLSMMEMEDKAHAKPSSLSGGESQRVAVARALVNDPRLILADEPTGNLDLKTGERIKELLFGIIRKLGGTMIIVTHNRLIARDADTAYRLENGSLNRLIEGSL
jgi:lipoprotein-releasing system ATP-binding protein